MKKYLTFLNHTLIKIGLFCIATSCMMQTIDTDTNPTQALISNEDQYGPYPASPPANEGSKDNFPLKCNYEWITVKGPNDELIVIKVLIECNPLADMYIGCPAPI